MELTEQQKAIFAKIAELEKELKKEAEALEKEGYTIESVYNRRINKDSLVLRKK